MDAVMYLSSALEANRALEAEGPIHSTGAGSSRAWVRAGARVFGLNTPS